MTVLPAAWYDGRTPRRQAATLRREGDDIVVVGDFGERRYSRSTVEVAEPLGRAPRLIRFADGTSCEVADHAAFAAWAAEAGFGESLAMKLQGRWHWALASLVATLVLVAAGYLWGLPAVAKVLAPRVPAAAVEALSAQTLAALDQHLLKPSQLPEARRKEIAASFQALVAGRPSLPAYRLHFRSSGLGPNAFALPNGDVVIFDELVKLAGSDDEVAGVLAHELGHVAHRHGLRQLIQSSVVAFVAGLYLGDTSSLVAGLSTLALESRYSREFELEADAYAGRLMLAAGRGTRPLAAMLERLEAAHGGRGEARGWWSGLESHPQVTERVRALQAQR